MLILDMQKCSNVTVVTEPATVGLTQSSEELLGKA